MQLRAVGCRRNCWPGKRPQPQTYEVCVSGLRFERRPRQVHAVLIEERCWILNLLADEPLGCLLRHSGGDHLEMDRGRLPADDLESMFTTPTGTTAAPLAETSRWEQLRSLPTLRSRHCKASVASSQYSQGTSVSDVFLASGRTLPYVFAQTCQLRQVSIADTPWKMDGYFLGLRNTLKAST